MARRGMRRRAARAESRTPRVLYTCPHCGETLSAPAALYSYCPARDGNPAATGGRRRRRAADPSREEES